jgi:hypothetical protein
MNPPYIVLGWGTSTTIILVVAIIAVFVILRDRGLISASSKPPRNRRKVKRAYSLKKRRT